MASQGAIRHPEIVPAQSRVVVLRAACFPKGDLAGVIVVNGWLLTRSEHADCG
jgi:hypothetical protein